MDHFKVKVRIEVERDGDEFYAFCPDLKGVHVDGATEEEARSNAVSAVRLYLQSMVAHDESIPVGVMDTSAEAPRHAAAHEGATIEEILVPA
jgi:predicted RNase H-like HicB family nuclease